MPPQPVGSLQSLRSPSEVRTVAPEIHPLLPTSTDIVTRCVGTLKPRAIGIRVEGRKNLLRSLAASAGLLAIAFAAYVYVFV
jgi:hypothetical protein